MVAKRGKRAAADLEVTPLLPGPPKPAPPKDASQREAVAWWSIVDVMPPGWFGGETHPVLQGLCRAKVASDFIWERYFALLEAGADYEELAPWAALHNRELTQVRRCSADLRLTKIAQIANQGLADRRKAAQPIGKAWEL